jgi:hypothetical protein
MWANNVKLIYTRSYSCGPRKLPLFAFKDLMRAEASEGCTWAGMRKIKYFVNENERERHENE